MIRALRASATDKDELVERALTLWRRASGEARGEGLELYIKVAARRRVEADDLCRGIRAQETLESGHAVRAITRESAMAGFAAASGLSEDAVRASARAALMRDDPVQGQTPSHESSTASRREDLDSDQPLPDIDELRTILHEVPSLRWVECGTTLEVLVGPDGWTTLRRRNRTWGERVGVGRQLLAKRGFPSELAHPSEWERSWSRPGQSPRSLPTRLVLAPHAAAPIVEALAVKYFVDPVEAAPPGGKGWTLDDAPSDERGLSGGTFDDAGFPTRETGLEREGTPVGVLSGSGHLWRLSFRRPPITGFSNLVLATSEPKRGEISSGIPIDHASVVRLSQNDWVLDLERNGMGGDAGPTRDDLRFRCTPSQIAQSLEMGVGPQEVTAGGTILPAVVLAGLLT